MKFTLSTKPLVDALNIGVINGNISKFYLKSCLAQLTATKKALTINLEASAVVSEIILKGQGDSDETATVFVDCLLLKQLVSTFESSTVTIEYIEGGIILHSGSSKFTLSKMIEGTQLSLRTPELAPKNSVSIPVDKSKWKFIEDYQMYAIAMSFVTPIYTRVWMGSDGQVIVCDFNEQLFTTSSKGSLGQTCLVSDTIVNLFNNLPDDAKITQIGKSYRIDVKTDGFEYAAQFDPQYEGDEGVGNYKSDVILDTMHADETNCFSVPVLAVAKSLSQSDLLSRSSDDTIVMSLEGDEFRLKDENIDCKVKVEGNCAPFKVEFTTRLLKSVMSNLDEDVVKISPVIDESGVAAGIVLWTSDLKVMLGGRD